MYERKNMRLGFVSSQIIAENVGFREKVFVIKTNITFLHAKYEDMNLHFR